MSALPKPTAAVVPGISLTLDHHNVDYVFSGLVIQIYFARCALLKLVMGKGESRIFPRRLPSVTA